MKAAQVLELVGLKTLSLRRRPAFVQRAIRKLVPELGRETAAYVYAAMLLLRASAITFDYHGIIINDEECSRQATKEVFRKHGLNVWDQQYDAYFLGRPDYESFANYFVRQSSLRREAVNPPVPISQLVEEKLEVYLRLVGELDSGRLFFDKIKDIITLLGSSGLNKSLAVVATVQSERLQAGLERLGVAQLFGNKTVDLSHSLRGKPSPEMYMRSLRLHGSHAHGLRVAIEDTPVGVEAAKKAKMFCIAVLNTSSYQELQKAGADVVVYSFQGLHRALKLMAKG